MDFLSLQYLQYLQSGNLSASAFAFSLAKRRPKDTALGRIRTWSSFVGLRCSQAAQVATKVGPSASFGVFLSCLLLDVAWVCYGLFMVCLLLGFKKLQSLPHYSATSDPSDPIAGHLTGSAGSDNFGDLGDFGGSSGLAAWAVPMPEASGWRQKSAYITKTRPGSVWKCLESRK